MFYYLYLDLCNKKNVTPTRAALEIGISKSTPTTWKKRGLTPQGETLSKIADYFGVTTDYLLGAEKEKAPTLKSERNIDNEVKFALFGGEGEITDEMYDEVKSFAEFLKKKYENRG